MLSDEINMFKLNTRKKSNTTEKFDILAIHGNYNYVPLSSSTSIFGKRAVNGKYYSFSFNLETGLFNNHY